MIKSYTEPRFGSSDNPHASRATSESPNGMLMTESKDSSTDSDREKYKRRIAAMIHGVNSEMAEMNRSNMPDRPFQAVDLRLSRVKAAHMGSTSHSDSDIRLEHACHQQTQVNNNGNGQSPTSSQSDSLCNLYTTTHLGGSQSSLSHLQPTSLANVSTLGLSQITKPSFRVNLAALLNDPRPGKRPIYVFSRLYGEAFERTATHPIPDLPGPGYNPSSTRELARYLKIVRKRNSQLRMRFGPKEQPDRPTSPTSQDLTFIPQEFFQSTFSLSNPDTFYALFPWLKDSSSSIERPDKSSANDNLQQSTAMHDRLSMYLDTVEAEISRQVSSRSDSFFSTMTSQEVLQAYLAQTLVAVKSLRSKLKNVKTSFVVTPMQLMRLSSNRGRYVEVLKKLRLISTISSTQSTIQVLLSSGDYSGAIDLIRTTQEVVSEDLRGLVAFRYLPVQLAEVERTIDTMLCDEIHDCLAREFNRVDNNVAIQDETRLIGIALGLLKLHRFVFLDALVEEAGTAIKAVIKSSVIQSVSSSDSLAITVNNQISLEDQLRQLAPAEWLGLVEAMFKSLSSLLDRVQAIKEMLWEMVVVAAGKEEPAAQRDRTPSTSTSLIIAAEDSQNVRLPESVYTKLKAQFFDTMHAISDLAQQRAIKVLEIRQKSTTSGSSDRTSVIDFLSFSAIADSFVVRLAEMLERPSKNLPAGSPLPAFVHCQNARFISHFHDERRHKLAEILDTEMWKAAVVPADFQRLMDVVLDTNRLVLMPTSPSNESNLSGGSDVAVATPSKTIDVNGVEYYVTGTSLILFRLITEYGDCASKMPTSAADLLNKLLELLKTFNSRTCQLVLGAGAVQLLGIRTITAGHLALSARSLQFVLCLFPKIRKHFTGIISESGSPFTSSKYIDQLQRDYTDHVNEIMNKILGVVDAAIGDQFSSWEAKPPVPSPLVKSVSSQLKRLNDTVANIMPADSRREIFSKVSMSFRDQMSNRLRQLDIRLEKNTSACGIISQEIAFFNEQIRSFNLGISNISVGDFMPKTVR